MLDADRPSLLVIAPDAWRLSSLPCSGVPIQKLGSGKNKSLISEDLS